MHKVRYLGHDSLSSSPRRPSRPSPPCPRSTASTAAWTMAAATGSRTTHDPIPESTAGAWPCASSRPSASAAWRSSPRTPTSRHLGITSLLALRFALAALIFWAIARRPRGARSPSRPRRVLLAASASAPSATPPSPASSSAPVKRMDASTTVAAALHVPRDRLHRRAGAAPRARRPPRASPRWRSPRAGTALVLLRRRGSGSFEAVGVVMALAAAVAYSTYILVADTRRRRRSTRSCSARWSPPARATTFWSPALVHGGLDLALSAHGWLDIAGIVLVSTVLPVTTFLARPRARRRRRRRASSRASSRS